MEIKKIIIKCEVMICNAAIKAVSLDDITCRGIFYQPARPINLQELKENVTAKKHN